MTVRSAPVPGMWSRRICQRFWVRSSLYSTAAGLAGDGGEPRLDETSMAQWRQLEAHSVGGGLDGGNAGLARGVERIGAGEEFHGVGDASRPFPTSTIPRLRLGRRCRAGWVAMAGRRGRVQAALRRSAGPSRRCRRSGRWSQCGSGCSCEPAARYYPSARSSTGTSTRFVLKIRPLCSFCNSRRRRPISAGA